MYEMGQAQGRRKKHLKRRIIRLSGGTKLPFIFQYSTSKVAPQSIVLGNTRSPGFEAQLKARKVATLGTVLPKLDTCTKTELLSTQHIPRPSVTLPKLSSKVESLPTLRVQRSKTRPRLQPRGKTYIVLDNTSHNYLDEAQVEIEQEDRDPDLEQNNQHQLELQAKQQLERQHQAQLERQQQLDLERQHQAQLERQQQAYAG